VLRSDCSGQILFPELLWFSAWHLYSAVYNPHPQITLFIPNTQKRLCTSQCVSADPHIPEVLTSRNNSRNTPVSYFPNGPARFAPTFIIDVHKRIELCSEHLYKWVLTSTTKHFSAVQWNYWISSSVLNLGRKMPSWTSSTDPLVILISSWILNFMHLIVLHSTLYVLHSTLYFYTLILTPKPL